MPANPAPYSISDLKEQIDIICQEKGLETSEVMKAIENSIASAYRKDFGDRDKAYEAEFDIYKNSYTIFEVMYVVDEVTNPLQQLTMMEARVEKPNAVEGDSIRKKIDLDELFNFGRIASQIAKQVLFQSINNVRHSKLLQQFKNSVGDIISVEVDYFHKGGYHVKMGQTMGYLAKEQIMQIDKFKSGAIIKVLIVSITEDHRGNSKVLLSRTHPDFIKAIIRNEIPEVENGLILIDKIARDPGLRSKILVSCAEGEDLDPVGAILGKKNMRIINIMRQISPTMQEKIDIIENQNDDFELMLMDTLEPAQIDRVEVSEDGKKADIYVYKDEAALAVGRRGSNIRLAQELLDIELNIITFDDMGNIITEEERKQERENLKNETNSNI